MSAEDLKTYIERLEKQAKPDKNDKRHSQYAQWANVYMSYFGGDEAHLVGSTTEGLKLRSRHQGGDADFLLRSGKLEIPIDWLEPREATPCYVRVKGNNLPVEFRQDVVNGYLSADIVRKMNPKLFTTMRAIVTIATTTSDDIPGRESRVTTTGLPMKVGTARKEFRNLHIDGIDSPDFRSKRRRLMQTRRSDVAARLRTRWVGVQRPESDVKTLRRLLNVFTDLQVSGSNGRMFGQLNNLGTLLNSVLQRPPLEADEDQENVEFNNDLDAADAERTYKATYSEMTSKDFVPAIKIASDRKLECMVVWYARVKKGTWPPRALVDELYNTGLFIVARDAPIDPDHQIDFCISFNVLELKLCKSLTAEQRKVYLILKAYLNGVLKKKHDELGIELKLKSYYLKTALFWVCEKEDGSIWAERNIVNAVVKVLNYLQRCLSDRHLSHYFVVKSNLFAEMGDLDFDVLQECIREIKMDPVYSIEEFFNQDANARAEVWLTEEEVRCIQHMREDGGDQEAMDNLEDALIDIQRGFNESRRDENGNIPFKQAVLELLDLFFADERAREAENATSNLSLGGASNIQPNASPNALISGLIGSFVTSGGQRPVDRQRVGQAADLLNMFSQFVPEVSQHVANLGGRDGIESVVAQQGSSKEEQRRKMRDVTDRYLSCSDADVDMIRMELKQIYAGYFLGRQE